MPLSYLSALRVYLATALALLLCSCQPTSQAPGQAAKPAPNATSPSPAASTLLPAQDHLVTKATPQAIHSKAPIKPVDVVIVGGGLSGLSTAYYLKKAGISYRVLELSPRVGGRARTSTYPDGTAAEVGLAEFWTGNPGLKIIEELNLTLELTQPGLSSFIVDGKLYPFLSENSNQEFIAHSLGSDYAQYQVWDKKMQQLIHTIESGTMTAELMQLKDISFEKWLATQKLSPLTKGMVKAVLEPEIGTTISRISALDGIAEWHIFVGQGANPNHIKGGNEQLAEAMADAIGRENISLNTQVTNIIDNPDGVEVRALDTSTFDNQSFKGKYVVTAIPLYRLFEIQFSPNLSETIYKAIDSQGWGAYLTAHCELDKKAEKFWTEGKNSALPILSGGPLGCIYAGQEGGPADRVLINCLVTGPFAERFNDRTKSFDEVQAEMEKALDELWPGSKALVKSWTFYRYHPRAIASWPVGRSRFDQLSNELRKPYGHIYFAGDFTESSHSDGAFISAIRVSEQIKKSVKP